MWMHARHYGLQMEPQVGVISISPGRILPSGDVEAKCIELHCTRSRPEVQLYTKLKRNGFEEDELEQFHELILSEREAVFQLTLPEPGKLTYS